MFRCEMFESTVFTLAATQIGKNQPSRKSRKTNFTKISIPFLQSWDREGEFYLQIEDLKLYHGRL